MCVCVKERARERSVIMMLPVLARRFAPAVVTAIGDFVELAKSCGSNGCVCVCVCVSACVCVR